MFAMPMQNLRQTPHDLKFCFHIQLLRRNLWKPSVIIVKIVNPQVFFLKISFFQKFQSPISFQYLVKAGVLGNGGFLCGQIEPAHLNWHP